jgi:lipopolysaccharide transport system ATP-binding protein
VAKSGRTVLFVSHNLGAVRALCSSVLLLEGGRVAFRGATEEGLARYEASLAEGGTAIAAMRFTGPLADRVRFASLALRPGGEEVAVIDPTAPVEIELEGEASEELGTLELNLGVSRDGVRLFSCHDASPGAALRRGTFRSRFEIAAGVLRPGRYVIGVGAYRPGGGDWTWCPDVTVVEVSERWSPLVQSRDHGLVSVPYQAERTQ